MGSAVRPSAASWESVQFRERNYGASSFRVLLSRLPDLVEVKKDRSSSDMLVTLVAARPPKAAAKRRTAAKDSTGASARRQKSAAKPTATP